MAPMTNYQKGYRLEKRARDFLEGMGYFVIESRGSHGPVDLVAIPLRPVAAATNGLVRLIQVKSGTSARKDERGRLKTLASKLGKGNVLVELWCYPPWQTKPTMEGIE